MNLQFISGLALIIVTLGVLAYVIKEFFDIQAGDLKSIRHYFIGVFQKHAAREAKPVNSHLIGVIGEVTAHSGDSERPMRVRLNLESWPGRSSSTSGGLPPVGSSVRVTEVDGPVLIVEADDAVGLPATSD